MNSEDRQRILDRAAARKTAAVSEIPQGAEQTHAPAQPSVRATGDAVIRVIDENNPPTKVSRGIGPRQRPAGTPAQQGPRTVGAKIVQDQQPGPRSRAVRSHGQYGAAVRSPDGVNVVVQGAQPVGQALRTPLRSPAPPQAYAPPAPTGAAALSAQIQAIGQRPGAGVTVASVPPSQPPVTAVMSQHLRPATLEAQYRSLRASGIEDSELWCWVNPAPGVRLNDGLLGRVIRFLANRDMGPWFRWSLVSRVETKYTLVIDDDCIPGPQWISRGIERLELAEAEGDKLVVTAAGLCFGSDRVDDVELFGPESLHREETDVDLGRGAWLLPTDLARTVLNFPQIGSLLSTSFHVAAALQNEGVQQIVLPYPHNDRHAWGMLSSPQVEGSMSSKIDAEARQGQGPTSAALRAGDYDVFRVEWEPLCVIAATAATVEMKPMDLSEGPEAESAQA